MSDPKYIKVTEDTDVLYHLEDFNSGDMVFIPTGESVTDPIDSDDPDAVDDFYVARATPQEMSEWMKDAVSLREIAESAMRELNDAREVWEAAQRTATARMTAAWQIYQPTHELIDERIDEVTKIRDEFAEAEAERERQEKQAAQDREDAELGPRTWAVFQNSDTYGVKKRDMLVPVLHLAGCSVLKGSEDYPYDRIARRLRIAEAHEILLTGGPDLARAGVHGYGRTGKTLPTKLCGRCKPHDSLRAELGEIFDGWLDEVESVQPPLPTERKLLQDLVGVLEPWFHPGTDEGFTRAAEDKYRKAGRIEEYETLVGWGEKRPSGRVVIDAPDKLAEIEKILPQHGWVVRRFTDIWGDDPQECMSSVAIRRMTKAEIRKLKQADTTESA